MFDLRQLELAGNGAQSQSGRRRLPQYGKAVQAVRAAIAGGNMTVLELIERTGLSHKVCYEVTLRMRRDGRLKEVGRQPRAGSKGRSTVAVLGPGPNF